MLRPLSQLSFCGAWLLLAATVQAACLRLAQDGSHASFFDGECLVLRYRYADVSKKPYADRLASPAGVQLLRDSPRDHIHHHGLMYAVAVDGSNSWEERGENLCSQRHVALAEKKPTQINGVERTGFVEELEWVSETSGKPIMIERRAIDVFRAADLGATLVEWRCRLRTPPDKESITLGNHTHGHYHGLGMRFVASMDKDGRFFNANDAAGESIRGTEKLTPVKWAAYTAKADGKPVTVALFDSPRNPRHPARMFTMTQPFAYLSATLNEWREPITIRSGHPLELHYGVAVWDGTANKAAIEKLYQRWLTLSNNKPKHR
jgi:hypothetical protein